MERVILHSDLNSFYASVEMQLDPALRGRPVAVCGAVENRHGICLAKSQKAKEAGVKTGMAVWQAKQCCPELVVVPPHYEQYVKFSELARQIYRRYTDRVEPFGMDECWLDLTGCPVKDGRAAADELRRVMRDELGLTVSVGVSFNKTFAKLGSDLKKPDGTTVIGADFRRTIWPLPAQELLYVGPATARKLASHGIFTIGQIAQAQPEFLRRLLGVNGLSLHAAANGRDGARVMPDGYDAPVQSVGHGVTCRSDLTDPDEMFRILLELAQDVGRRLRSYHLRARGVQLGVRDSYLSTRQFQRRLEVATADAQEIARCGRALLRQWRGGAVRALTITAIDLCEESAARQLTLFDDDDRRVRRERLNRTMDELQSRFGCRALYPSSLLLNEKMPHDGHHEIRLPGQMYR